LVAIERVTLPPDDVLTTEHLKNLKSDNTPQVYIGCPVWSDKNYVGKMYPYKTKPADYLKAYCKQFNSIEVNATRYGMKDEQTWKQWKEAATDNFKFSFKLPDNITNRKNLADQKGSHLELFYQAADYFGTSAGASLCLLPNYFKTPRLDQLVAFLNDVPKDIELAIELRDPETIINPELYALLKAHNHCLVITDSPGRRDVIHQRITNSSVFIRFVGGRLHSTDFTRIDAWVDRLVYWMNSGVKTVYFYMHQAAPYKYLSANLAAYMIEKLNAKMPKLNLKAPKDYSLDDQQSLF